MDDDEDLSRALESNDTKRHLIARSFTGSEKQKALRPKVYARLLGVQDSFRSEFDKLIQLIPDFLDANDTLLLSIAADCIRTFPEVAWFSQTCVLDEWTRDLWLRVAHSNPSLDVDTESFPNGARRLALLKPLFLYATLNKGLGYVQSMSPVMGICFYIASVDGAASLRNEALAFSLFSALAAFLSDVYVGDVTRLESLFAAYDHKLSAAAPLTSRALRRRKVVPSLYLVRWVSTLFSMALPLPETLGVWDDIARYVSTGDPPARFYEYLVDACVALTITQDSQWHLSDSLFTSLECWVDVLSRPSVDTDRWREVIASVQGQDNALSGGHVSQDDTSQEGLSFEGSSLSSETTQSLARDSPSPAQTLASQDLQGIPPDKGITSLDKDNFLNKDTSEDASIPDAAHLSWKELQEAQQRVASSDAAARMAKAASNLSAHALVLSSQLKDTVAKGAQDSKTYLQDLNKLKDVIVDAKPPSPVLDPFTPPKLSQPRFRSTRKGSGPVYNVDSAFGELAPAAHIKESSFAKHGLGIASDTSALGSLTDRFDQLMGSDDVDVPRPRSLGQDATEYTGAYTTEHRHSHKESSAARPSLHVRPARSGNLAGPRAAPSSSPRDDGLATPRYASPVESTASRSARSFNDRRRQALVFDDSDPSFESQDSQTSVSSVPKDVYFKQVSQSPVDDDAPAHPAWGSDDVMVPKASISRRHVQNKRRSSAKYAS